MGGQEFFESSPKRQQLSVKVGIVYLEAERTLDIKRNEGLNRNIIPQYGDSWS